MTRAAAVPAVLLLTALAACGQSADTSEPSGSPSPSASASPSGSPSGSAGAVEPGAAADGKCGGGAFETTTVDLFQDARITVPADWEVESFRAGLQNRFYPPDRDVGDGYLAIEPSTQTLDEAVDDVLEATRASARTTSEQELELPGFDGARMVTFAYDDSTFAVNVVAVYRGFRLQANMTREGVPEEQPVAESCLSSISRPS
ncbi:hypothetical protein ASG49_00025 [Marmoricola sp. Leaf446]|nr:hypothetical protein ASG49_00025 [Marmoricola sp. Leaf446]